MELTLSYKGKIRNSDEARSFWRSHSRRQVKIQNYFVPKIFNALKGQINAFLNVIDRYGYEYAKNHLDEIIPIEPIAKVLKELYHKAAYIEGNYVFNYIKDNSRTWNTEEKRLRRPDASFGIGFDDLAEIIDQYFEIYLLNKSALPVTQNTKNLIRDHLIKEVDSGKPLKQAITDFKEFAITGGRPRSITRAILIAKTESTRSMSFGGLIGAYMTGVDLDKVWVTCDDERVRRRPINKFSHVELDLQVTEMMRPFYNGENIKFPGDPDASKENTANCRCAMYFREKLRPKPRVTTRDILKFLSDFFIGFIIGAELIDQLTDE